MKLTSIRIVGFKSINELCFPIKEYGNSKSYTTILLGKNETGKSNILDAMSIPLLAENKKEVNFCNIRNNQTEPERTSVFFSFIPEENDNYQKIIAESIEIPDQLLEKIKIKEFIKETFLQSDSSTYSTNCDIILDKISLNNYSFTETQKKVPPTPSPNLENNQQSKPIKVIINNNSDIKEDERDSYVPLDMDSLKKLLLETLTDFINEIPLPINVWKASPDYLIQEKILLKEFANNPSNIPLKNMFFLVNKKSDEEILQKINEINNNDKERHKLARLLSKKTTEYLNNKWKEHEIEIEVEIQDNLTMTVYVKDKCDEDNPFNMADRSQGFKQFISLLLSLSISNASGEISNSLILIDEPEIHLHPSGIRYMLKELLEIGKNNYLFISTHSNFMIDRKTRDRHFLLTKGKDNITKCRQIKTEENLNDDELLMTAFGINIANDFISPYKVLVEGNTDKKLLLKALNKIYKNHNIAITNGNGSNIPAIASILSFQDIVPITITDDDSMGKEIKKTVSKIGEKFKNNTFTIRDLNGNLPDGSTIEDSLPKEYVESRINKTLSENKLSNITLNDSPFCAQLEQHLNKTIPEKNRTKTEKKSIKEKIISDIKTSIANYDEKSITEERTPKLYNLAKAILDKLGIE